MAKSNNKAATPSEIKQTELAEYLVLKQSSEGYAKLRKDMIDRFKDGAAVEVGTLALQVNVEQSSSVKYKQALIDLVEKHPTLMKEAATIIRKNTSPKTDNEIVITAAAAVTP